MYQCAKPIASHLSGWNEIKYYGSEFIVLLICHLTLSKNKISGYFKSERYRLMFSFMSQALSCWQKVQETFKNAVNIFASILGFFLFLSFNYYYYLISLCNKSRKQYLLSKIYTSTHAHTTRTHTHARTHTHTHAQTRTLFQSTPTIIVITTYKY